MVIQSLVSKSVYLDTAPLIYFIEGHSSHQRTLARLFSLADKGELTFVTSTITLLEVLVKPLREGRSSIARQYKDILTNASGIEIVDITAAVAEQAAILRGKYSLRTPDAIQLAASIDSAADVFLTNDLRLKAISEVDVVTVGELL
jgi:predicted nucleic acid-binding protein